MAWSGSNSYQGSPAQPCGMAHGVKWVATAEPGGKNVETRRWPVDAHGDGATDQLDVEWREGAGEAQVDDVQPFSRCRLQAHVVLDGPEGRRLDIVDPVDGRVLELDQARRRGVAPADDEPLVPCGCAPVRVVAGEADLGAPVPALRSVRTGPVDLAHDRRFAAALAVARVRLEPGGVVDGERRSRDLRQEGDVRPAELEGHRGGVGRGDPLEVPGVRRVARVRGLLLTARGVAAGRVRRGRERPVREDWRGRRGAPGSAAPSRSAARSCRTPRRTGPPRALARAHRMIASLVVTRPVLAPAAEGRVPGGRWPRGRPERAEA